MSNNKQTMKNNKQDHIVDTNKMVSSVELFAIALYEKSLLIGNGDLIQTILDLHKSRHEQEIVKAWKNGDGQYDETAEQFANDYYKQTYSDESNN